MQLSPWAYATIYGIETTLENWQSCINFFLDDWIFLVYKDGTKYSSYCDKQNREAWVKIVCDKSGKVCDIYASIQSIICSLTGPI